MPTLSPRDLTFLRLVAAAVVVLVSLGVHAPGAAALSCVDPGIDGADGLPALLDSNWLDTPFFDTFDLAITGTVADITTIQDGESADDGRTTTSFEVINGYGIDTVGTTIDVTSTDPGWLAGYPFEIGTTYFVPLHEVGSKGEPNYSFVCDPIITMTPADATRVASDVSESVAVATPKLDGAAPTTTVNAATPPTTIDAQPASTNAADSTPTPSGGINRTAAVLAGLALIIALAVTMLWRRDAQHVAGM